jgi:hypothetical protein
MLRQGKPVCAKRCTPAKNSQRVLLKTYTRPDLPVQRVYGKDATRSHYEACSLLDATGTPEYSTFDEIRRSKGLGEAMKWRDAQFAPFE